MQKGPAGQGQIEKQPFEGADAQRGEDGGASIYMGIASVERCQAEQPMEGACAEYCKIFEEKKLPE